jgi:putative Holliday junction resolvase
MNESSEPAAFPAAGRLLGIDFGTKRLGIAVSTPEQTIASPLENYTLRGGVADWDHLRKLAADYQVVGVVVGLPVHMSGEEGGQARQAREFGARLSRELGLPLRYWDERFTSSFAAEALSAAGLTRRQRHARLDKLAAQLMLQSYLDAADQTAAPTSAR